MRVGLFGGSFDPVHYGHLLLAETCREQCRLDEVWFIPAAVPPHKQEQGRTAARLRVEMLELAVGGDEHFRVVTLEIDRGGVSYTVDTLEVVHQQRPSDELFLLMGADTLFDLPTWRNPVRICELVIPVVVRRAGSPSPDLSILTGIASPQRIAAVEKHQVEMPILDLSSREIRRRVATGESIRYRTPRAVEKFIQTNSLYLPPAGQVSRPSDPTTAE